MQCVVTSPPYWGLRCYDTDPQIWGGQDNCQHQWDTITKPRRTRKWEDVTNSPKQRTSPGSIHGENTGKACSICGAWKGELGAEPTPELYTEHIVSVFMEVHRVLHPTGTLWLNIGDSYAGYHGNSKKPDHEAPSNKPGYIENMRQSTVGISGLKPKDLVGIPWRVAFSLQSKGWYLRQDLIWQKPSVMPSSVKDRCTTSHEYIFLLTKSSKYYYNAHAIKEKGVYPAGTKAAKGSAERFAQKKVNSRPPEYKIYDGYRNCRSVWTIKTKPFKGAHFATFPPELVERCLLSGSKSNDLVLDPFAGSGTTLCVAEKLGRYGIGIELNKNYMEICKKRLSENAKELKSAKKWDTFK